MPATFSLTKADYKLLERAVFARIQRTHGRLSAAWFAQVFAWMFITLAVFTFFKLWQRHPEVVQPFGMILLFAVLGFLFAVLRPLAGQWLYQQYVAASDPWFTAEQRIDVQDGALLLESPTGKATVPRSAVIDHSEDERNHYLFITGVQAITIPKVVAKELGAEFTNFLSVRSGEA